MAENRIGDMCGNCGHLLRLHINGRCWKDCVCQAPTLLLTDRQFDVLKCMAKGLTTKEIAVILHLSPSTVDVHKDNMMRRTQCHTQLMLVLTAIRSDIIDIKDLPDLHMIIGHIPNTHENLNRHQ